ncbi:ASCH domain-containing protein [Fulvivirga sp. M361]|uniref:ASCH domain-containing protein n=1 Tax=Fulvivirga sp. M361 TaxID=2594266 RepID=UPI00117BDAEC|nr:ASCH domain-containing protein [Fulvivirga sp. M361]TRX46335.1 ASCH domain-containing protein [Fulvivirga sp. M361]
MKVLLSIKPEYANKIFSGEKKFEFRKRAFGKMEVRTVVVYSTMPVGRIIGEFSIKEIHQDSPESIWSKTKRFSGIDKGFFNEYYDGRDLAIAIEVDKPVLYDNPINPKKEYENFTAPQSFMYL